MVNYLIITLYFGSEFLVDGAVNLAKQISISEAVISVTILPLELVFQNWQPPWWQ